MKYYNELSKIEDSLIQLDLFNSLASVLSNAVESESAENKDIQNSLYILTDNLQTISQKLNEDFQELWEVIRQDSFNVNELPEQNFETMNHEPLQSVMHKWVEP